MDRGKILLAVLSIASGVASWALGKIVEPLRYLPYFALPISGAVALLMGALIFFDWRKATQRKGLPGFGVHMLLRIGDINEPRRRYVFSLGDPDAPGGSFYLNASDHFVFSVRDARGEPYNLEIPSGWRGLPIAEPGYFALEAGTDGVRTFMWVIFNGRVVGERTLPFAIQFGELKPEWTIGANHGKDFGAFTIGALAITRCTFTHKESRDMATAFLSAWGLTA